MEGFGMSGVLISSYGKIADGLSKFLGELIQHALLFVICAFAVPMTSTGEVRADEATSYESRSHVVVVVGASGAPEYGEQFSKWAGSWGSVAKHADASITLIGQSEPSHTSDRERLRDTLAKFPNTNHDSLWLVLIGHGTFARNTAKFNLRGPDITATELAQWLREIEQPVVVVNCSSASGPFINRLSGDNRIVVTATKSGTEQNYARFGAFIAKSIASLDSDLDHDGEVSIHEAFLRASAQVQQFYESEGRISTEHALIDDNGDGLGTPAKMFRGTRPIGNPKGGGKLDGSTASKMTLAPANQRLPFTQSERNKRRDLERRLTELRTASSSLNGDDVGEAAYYAELEPLMLELSKLYRAAEQRQKKNPAESP